MKVPFSLIMILPFTLFLSCKSAGPDFSGYPSTTISNDEVEMLIYLPDAEKGLYRATRFDWSGVIMSATWKGHEYFGYWKPTHDPLVHEDLGGPVEGYIAPGIGYEEAEPGEGFVRIGVGVVKKEDEDAYQWNGVYEILDHGKWKVDKGEDWIKFTHVLDADMGVSYIYMKKIRLKADGFLIEHTLQNTGEKEIETDQFNHNFFMIDGMQSGPGFEISFPFDISTEDDSRGLYVLEGNKLTISQPMEQGGPFVRLSGYGPDKSDHQFTVVNQKSGAGVSLQMDQPLHDLGFWSCATTLSPENTILISVKPGKEQKWTADYTFFINE